ncbi:MAG: type II CRISPR RNA-guided endonuclease Cas9 [Cryobacterium sp.]|nr:type II CRISPR RNA-guided endonuclease Cas9 [Cryobacterium sp.]
MRYRLGLDLGTNSLGWAVLELDQNSKPCRVVRIGSRIYGDGRNPKDGSSKAVERREPRQARRRRDRYLRRRELYIDALVRGGLFPTTEVERQALLSLNPFRLRAEGLERELTSFEFGRALFHLQQRRGFKSNRKTDKPSKDGEEDSGKIKSAIAEFAGEMAGSTVGATLWKRIQNGKQARPRLHGSGAKASYDFYVGREMVAHEFDELWNAQESFAPGRFSEESRNELRSILLFQRDLLPQDRGRCFLEPTELRAPIALPSSQLFRLYQEVNHLRLRNKQTLEERALTRAERDKIVDSLKSEIKRTLPSLRELIFGKADSRNWVFTLEGDKRKDLKGDQTAAKLSAPEAFGDSWFDLAAELREEIAEKVAEVDNEQVLREWLRANCDLNDAQLNFIIGISLPSDYLKLSTKAINKILPHLIDDWDGTSDQPLTYDKAVVAAGYKHHSDKRREELLFQLPYYGEILGQYTMPASRSNVESEHTFGKIGNPTVHIGLNQVRVVVNALIAKYGLPEQIVVELGRELSKSPEEKREIKKEQEANQERNDAIRQELERFGQEDNYDNRLRLRLFKELGATPVCIYTGRPISISKLFSNEFQVDHLLPVSVTLDDSYSNKVLVYHRANSDKARRSPYEAFGASPSGYDWADILRRAEILPPAKRRRFSPDAMEVDGVRKDFLARQLIDTQYLAKVAKQYLDSICADVGVTPGRLTGLLRGKWDLNSILSDSGKKERTDHRHHAIDAAVIAVTDRGLLQRMSTAAARAEDRDLDRVFEGFPDPWPTFRDELVEASERVVVSHKTDHGTGSALHNETAYGIVSGPDSTGKYRVRHRVPIQGLKMENLDNLQVSKAFRDELEEAILSSSGKAEQAKALSNVAAKSGRRSVRLEETLSVIPIYKRGTSVLDGSEPYKAYKGDSNYCYEIYRTEGGKWDGRVVSSFEAQSPEYQEFMRSARYRSTAWSGESLVMRVMSDDFVAIEENGRRILRIQKITSGTISMAEPQEANVDARERDKDSGFSYVRKTPNSLRVSKGRRVFVDELGNVKDPGFSE